MNYSESEIAFLESEAVNGKTSTMDSSAAYVRNLDRGIKEQYEAIYRRLINPKFVLCYWCGNEVFAMVRDVHKTYNAWKAAEAYKLQLLDEHEESHTVTPMDKETVKVERVKGKKDKDIRMNFGKPEDE